jgi:hypothetical protein
VPRPHEHLTRAKENEKLARTLGTASGVAVDWAVTMLFYAALHFIDGYLAGKAFKPLNHKQRDEEIENNGSLTDIYKHYRRLKDMSREARYNIASFADRDLEIAAERLRYIKAHLGF